MKREDVLTKLKLLQEKLARRPVKRDSPYLYLLSRKYYGSWNKLMIEAGYQCKEIQNPSIPPNLDNKLSYLLGLLSTDGHIQAIKDKGFYRTMIYTSEREEVEIISRLINEIFKYHVSVRGRKTGFSKRLNYEINIYSKKVALFLNSLGIPFGAKSYTIKVPEILIDKNENLFWHYLRGVFDGDGSIIFSESNTSFKISSGSVNFLNGLKEITNSQGFNLRVSKQDQNVWILRTNIKKDIARLYSLIYKDALFFYPRKKEKWSKHHI